MGNTVYASFADPSLAEKAAGALLDHGVRSEDLSVVTSHNGEMTTTSAGAWSNDNDNDAKNAADAGWGATKAAGDKVAQMGDWTMGTVSGALGNESAARDWNAAADRQNMEAKEHSGEAKAEWNDSIDNENRVSTTRDIDDERSDADEPKDIEGAAKHGISTTTGADAGAGAIKGAGWGLGIGAAAALASLFIPGVGLVVGGGALAAALGGVAATTAAGAASGAVTGYLKDQGVEDHVAANYERTVNGGGAILAVTLPSGDCSKEEAMTVLDKYGASNINAYDVRASSPGGYVA